jgi:hydrophobe/amphiphile efflux-1 (HAE1) family protein
MHAFSDFFLNRPRIVTMILIFLSIIGISATLLLPKEATPDVTIPMAFVQVIYPGVSSEDIEQEVTNKIEDAIEKLDEVDYYESHVAEGYTFTVVHFLAGTDIEQKIRETRDEITSIRNELPPDIEEPNVSDWSFSDEPIIAISLTSPVSPGELKRIAEDIEDSVDKVHGVGKVKIVGALDEEIHVNIDPAKLALYNLSLNNIAQVIKQENFNIPAGTNLVGTNKFVLRSMGKFDTLDEMGKLVLSANAGRIVTLSDVADISFTTEDRDSYARINGNNCLNLLVYKKTGENLLKTVDEIKTKLIELEKSFPPDTKYTYIGDGSWSVRESNTNLNQNLGWGLLLVFLILLFFLGFRSAVIITPTIPWSLFCGYIYIWTQGYSISNVVTFGAIIVLGMLVDDAIIVTENTMRHLEMGKDNKTAARDSIHEVGGAILAAGLTTFAAFAPMMFMPGIMGEFIKFIPIMVIASLGGAIIIAHGFTPVFCMYFLKKEEHQSQKGKILGGWIEPMIPVYRKLIQRSLKRPFLTAIIAWLLFFAAIGVVAFGHLQIEIFPSAPFYKYIIDIRAPVGTNIEETNRIVKEVEKKVADVPEVEFYVASVGDGAGETNIHRYSGGSSDNFGSIFGDLKEVKGGRKPHEIINEMRTKVEGISGADIDFISIDMGPPGGSAIEIILTGKDFSELEKISEDVQDILADINGIIDISDNYNPGFPEVQIEIDRERAALHGLTNTMIGAEIRAAFDGVDAGEFYMEGEEYDIIVQFPEDKRSSIEDLRRINFRNMKGQLIPFSQVADTKITSGIAKIIHRDGERTITVSAEIDTLSGETANSVKKKYDEILEEYNLPSGYEFKFEGQNKELEDDFIALMKAMIIGLMVMYIILAVTFDSFHMPLTVLGAIPFACIGVVVGLIVTGNRFGFLPGVGIVSLSGIVINDAIVLIVYINQLRKKGMSIEDALIKGGCDRFRPVLMTSITTIMGILPLAIGIGGGSEFWGPLGWAIVFGLIFSTVLILLIIPSFYKINAWLFHPGEYVQTDTRFLRFFRIVTLIAFGLGMAVIIVGAAFFVLSTG